MTRPPHEELILDQFTRQALPFSTAKRSPTSALCS